MALTTLSSARRVADYAEGLGAIASVDDCCVSTHLGAALADSILQAGVNYRTVVRRRVERIVLSYPQAATLSGTIEVIESQKTSEFLQWTHEDKIRRFMALVAALELYRVEYAEDLRNCLQTQECRRTLLDICGVGPKTVDYLSGLVGIDCVAVDRHVTLFARRAGIEIDDYEETKLVVSYAADLLGLSRRSFDSWIWKMMADERSGKSCFRKESK